MRFSDLIRVVWNNLWRRKGRTILTTIGVIIGTASIITMMALGIGMKNNLSSQLGSIGSAQEITVMPEIKISGSSPFSTGISSSDILDKKDIDKIKKAKNIKSITPVFTLYADTEIKAGRYSANMSIIGYDPKNGDPGQEKMSEGKFINKDRGLTMVVGYKVPELFKDTSNNKKNKTKSGITVKDDLDFSHLADKSNRINLMHKTVKLTISRTNPDGQSEKKALRVKVIGVVAEKGSTEDYSIYMPMSEVASLNDWVKNQSNTLKRQGFDNLKVLIDSPKNVDDAVQEISSMGYTVYSLKQLLEQVNKSLTIVQAILGGIGAIALLVASIGIINTMTMAIYERTKEIGIMKVIGASLRDIKKIFIFEAATIGFMGGVVGTAFSILVAKIIDFFMGMFIAGSSGSTQSQSIISIPPSLIAFAIVFATLVGLIAGLYPAMKAAKLSALNAIRTE